jgi:hypothetical protein
VQPVQVVPQRGPGQRPPAVVARQRHDAVPQPVELEPLAELEVHRRDLLDVETPILGHLHDVERGGHRAERGHPQGEPGRHPRLLQLLGPHRQRIEVRRPEQPRDGAVEH